MDKYKQRRTGGPRRLRRTLTREYPPVVKYILSLEGNTKCNRKEHKFLLSYINEYIKGFNRDKYWRLYVSLKLYNELTKVNSCINDYRGYMPTWNEYKDNSSMTNCGLIILRYFDFNLLFMKEHNFDYLFPYFSLLRGCLQDHVYEEIRPVYNKCNFTGGRQSNFLASRSGKEKLKAIDNNYQLSKEKLNMLKDKTLPVTTYRINNYYRLETYIGILPKDIRVLIDDYVKHVELVTIETAYDNLFQCSRQISTYPNVLGSFEN